MARKLLVYAGLFVLVCVVVAHPAESATAAKSLGGGLAVFAERLGTFFSGLVS